MEEKDLKMLDLSSWELLSDKHNSRVYNSPDKKWIVKSFAKGFGDSLADLEEEQRISREAKRLGISTPAVGDIVSIDGGIGLIFENLPDKISLARMLKNHPEDAAEIGVKMAKACKLLHTTPCNPAVFPSRAAWYRELLAESTNIPAENKPAIGRFIDSIPVENYCIHGDLYPSNIVYSRDTLYFIDLGTLSYGSPVLDVATFYYFSNLLPEELMMGTFYSDKKTARTLWVSFAKEYYGFKTEKEITDFDAYILPYAGLNALTFEHRRNAAFVKNLAQKCLVDILS